MRTERGYRLAFVIALGGMFVSAGTFGVFAVRDTPARHRKNTPAKVMAAYERLVLPSVADRAEEWEAPAAQSRGDEWVYDVFTPPRIFYSAATQRFSVTAPDRSTDSQAATSFPFELIEVRAEPLPLQLIGFSGDHDHWVGTFENLRTGEVFLGGAGRRISGLGYVVKAFEVTYAPVAIGDGTSSSQRVATATIRDERGTEYVLTSRERTAGPVLTGVVSTAEEPATRVVREGESFEVGGETYRVESLARTPGTIEVTRLSAGHVQGMRGTLLARRAATPAIAESGN